jgi:membrane protease YdiL (CAAX protease family)
MVDLPSFRPSLRTGANGGEGRARLPPPGSAGSVPPVEHPFERYVAPARRRPALWRLGLGVGVVVLVWLAVLVAVQAATLILDPSGLWWGRVARADHPAGALVMLASFAGLLLGTVVATRLLHARPAAGLLGPPGRAARDFGRAAAATAAAYAPMLGLWALVHDSLPGLPPATWLLYALPGLTAVALQTGAEEAAFRGYLQGQLAARFASPVAWALVPSLLFGAIHYDPTLPVANAAVYVGATATFGLLAADLTARTGTLGAAWGLHFANNAAALMLLGYPGELSGLALRLTPYGLDAPIPVLEVVLTSGGLLGAWALARRWCGAPGAPFAKPPRGA